MEAHCPFAFSRASQLITYLPFAYGIAGTSCGGQSCGIGIAMGEPNVTMRGELPPGAWVQITVRLPPTEMGFGVPAGIGFPFESLTLQR